MSRTKKAIPKIKNFDSRPAVKEFSDRLRSEFDQIGKRLGVKIQFKNVTYQSDRLTTKLNVTIEGAESLEEKAYRTLQEVYGLPNIGTIIQTSKGPRKIVGLNSRARKNKVILERDDGKRFVAPVAFINSLV